MAAYDLEEQERIDALKDWWEKWGNWVIAGLVVFFGSIAGTQAWKSWQAKQGEEAEVVFKGVTKTAQEVAANKEYKKLADAAGAMAEKFPRSFQATEAQLMAAKAAFDAGDLAVASKHLQWVIDKGQEAFRSVARLRLAQVLLDEKKHDEALKVVNAINEEGFAALAADLKGDILGAQGKAAEARAAYQLAVEKAGERSMSKALSQAKLDALGGSKSVESKDAAENKDKKS
ncbi:MAG TPA: tetratricopeptide repeat protein [Usitatibacteraceae bacterium]|nr:tetratricopeptide repeat protein [Usitatibacteraceae bacterium]